MPSVLDLLLNSIKDTSRLEKFISTKCFNTLNEIIKKVKIEDEDEELDTDYDGYFVERISLSSFFHIEIRAYPDTYDDDDYETTMITYTQFLFTLVFNTDWFNENFKNEPQFVKHNSMLKSGMGRMFKLAEYEYSSDNIKKYLSDEMFIKAHTQKFIEEIQKIEKIQQCICCCIGLAKKDDLCLGCFTDRERNTIKSPVDDDCPICCQKLDTDAFSITTCCKKVFHYTCLKTYYNMNEDNKEKCPCCRSNFKIVNL